MSTPPVPSPTPKSEVPMVVALEIVRLLTDWEFPVRVCGLEPFNTRVAHEPVIVPLVKVTLPPALQVPEPMDMDGVPVEVFEKLILPVIFTAGLLAAPLTVRAPVKAAVGVKSPANVNSWKTPEPKVMVLLPVPVFLKTMLFKV